jgi:hypothetical protein
MGRVRQQFRDSGQTVTAALCQPLIDRNHGSAFKLTPFETFFLRHL